MNLGNEGGNCYMSLGMGNVGSAGTSYDDGSDSIVPSTPVLYVPRRNDGFVLLFYIYQTIYTKIMLF